MKIKIGISSCPNDTFAFYALMNKLIKSDLELEFHIEDVETLNKMVIENYLDVSKISYHTYLYIYNKYKLLTSGSAIGNDNGPLIISKHKIYPDEIPYIRVAIPGYHTTAYLLLKLLLGTPKQVEEYLFSEIPAVVADGQTEAGLIIHETRFTYHRYGLKLVADIGKLWQNQTNTLIPLGGIAINRALDNNLQKQINALIGQSINFAYNNYKDALAFTLKFSQEKDIDLIRNYLKLYVNEFTINLGTDGKNSIYKLIDLAKEKENFNIDKNDVFVE